MLKNKVVVVTGGAGLLGQQFVEAIVKNNGIAIIADIDQKRSIKVQQRLMAKLNSNKIDTIQLDVTSKESILKCIAYLIGKFDKVDALVNNAYPRNKNYGKHFFDVED